MAKTDNLGVWYENRLIGILWRDSAGILGFRYEDSWLESGFAISQQMQLKQQEYLSEKGVAQQFFANLLPEGDARLHIVRDQKISDTDFELLKAIGGECAGALSVLPETMQPNKKFEYKKVTDDDFQSMLKRKRVIFSANHQGNRPRLSLAGAQDKCPLYYDGENYFWPLDDAASTHIIKFEIADYNNIPAYEYFLTRLAHTIGLPTVNAQLKNQEGIFFFQVERYDRVKNEDGIVKRLHQEDFCQALGVSHAKKYQQHGGPNFPDCYKLVQDVAISPAKDGENLLRWQIFNVLAGNSDGHAKNLALLYDENQAPSVAPFYDLVCTRAIKHIDTNMAMSIGTQFDPGKIAEKDWQLLAEQCEVRYSFLKQLILNMMDSLHVNMSPVIDEFEQTIGPYPALQRIQQVINKQLQRTQKLLKH